MDPIVAAALLAASLLHASWHALVKSSGDRVVALAGMNLVSGAVALALLPEAAMLPNIAFVVIACSVILHGAYKIALARLYVQADLGQAYPLARGLTPIMATLFAFLVLGESPRPMAVTGIALICLGIVALARERRQAIALRAFAAAAVVGTTVAAYSVLDAYGVRLTADWFSFTIWLVALDSACFSAYAVVTRGPRALRTWARGWRRVLVSGGLGVASFGVFMWALARAAVGPVCALRETSVLFAAVIGAFFLKEAAPPLRYAAATAVMAGIGVISVAR